MHNDLSRNRHSSKIHTKKKKKKKKEEKTQVTLWTRDAEIAVGL